MSKKKSEIAASEEQIMHQLPKLVMEGFSSKFQKLEISTEEKELLIYTILQEEQNKLIWLGEEQLWGMLSLKTKNTKHDFPDLVKKYSWGKRLKLLFILLGLNHTVKKDEAYIDYIVVKKEFRSKGIGSKLIEEAKKSIKPTDVLTLYVAANNLRAKKLYEEHGFVVKRTEYSLIRKLFNGIGKWYFMEWWPNK